MDLLEANSTLDSYCCITYYCKLSGFKQHSLIVSQFCRSDIQTQCYWVLRSESHKSEIKVSASSWSLSKLTGLYFLYVYCLGMLLASMSSLLSHANLALSTIQQFTSSCPAEECLSHFESRPTGRLQSL